MSAACRSTRSIRTRRATMLGVAALDSLPHHRPHGQPEKSIPVPHLLPSSSGAMRKGGSYSSGGVRSVTCTPDHPCRWEHFIFPGCQAVDEQAECEPQSRATTPPCLTVSSNILESSALRPGVWLAVLELAIWQSGERCSTRMQCTTQLSTIPRLLPLSRRELFDPAETRSPPRTC